MKYGVCTAEHATPPKPGSRGSLSPRPPFVSSTPSRHINKSPLPHDGRWRCADPPIIGKQRHPWMALPRAAVRSPYPRAP